MPTRRQEKVARVIKEAVSDVIINHLNDPRIEGFVSVTRVEMSPNLRDAEIYFSIFGEDEKVQKKTFIAITHAKSRIQSLIGSRVHSKFCPVLHFHMDDKFKKALEIIKLIDLAVDNPEMNEPDEPEEN